MPKKYTSKVLNTTELSADPAKVDFSVTDDLFLSSLVTNFKLFTFWASGQKLLVLPFATDTVENDITVELLSKCSFEEIAGSWQEDIEFLLFLLEKSLQNAQDRSDG